MLTCKKLIYCIVFVAATCLLASFGTRHRFAGGDLPKQRYRSGAIIDDIGKYSDQVVRDSLASDTPCVPYHVPLIPLPASIGVLQLPSPAAPPLLLTQDASPPRASPRRLS